MHEFRCAVVACVLLLGALAARPSCADVVGPPPPEAKAGAAEVNWTHAQHYDIILSDLRMPELDGVALYQEVERRWPHIARRVIFLSGNTEAPEYQGFLARLEGRTAAKPLDLAGLSALIQRALKPAE